MTPSALPIHLCAALRIEARAVAGHADVVTLVGIRAHRRDRLAALAAAGGPVALLGFGGGLQPSQRAGDVVVATEIRHPDGRTQLPGATGLLAVLRNAGLPASAGPLWCASHVVHGSQRAALAATGAVAVDMESAALADACGADRLLVARVLVDTPARGLVLGGLLGGRSAWRTLKRLGAAITADAWSTGDGSITSGTVKSAVPTTTGGRRTDNGRA